MDYIDLRSDTVTLPTEEMLEAMRHAKLGDDILGEDPTVNELENLASKMLGKEAALFTVSGTMSNQIAVMALTQRGQEIIVGHEAHIFNLEVAALSTLSQVQARPLVFRNGLLDPEELEFNISKPGIQTAETGLICLENTYDLNRGFAVPLNNIEAVAAVARKHGVPVYMDGARLFNAAVTLKTTASDLVRDVDAVQICLSKGLAAPVGSLLLGTKEFIAQARRIRQRLGGGMRQAGVLAAAGIVALLKMIDRLSLDHIRAQYLATSLNAIDNRLVRPNEVHTNIVSIDISPLEINPDKFYNGLFEKGIKVKRISTTRFRMICHHNIDDKDVTFVVEEIKNLVSDIQMRIR